MEYKDYYKALGVSKTATAQEIQKAYRALARKLHPDVNKEPGAEDRFKEVGEAYEVLSDADKRAKYDQYGSAWKSVQSGGAPPPDWEGFNFDFGGSNEPFSFGSTGFSSFFEMLFGREQGGSPGRQGHWRSPQTSARRSQRSRQQAADRETTIRLPLEDLSSGATRSLELLDPHSGKRRKLDVKIPAGVLPGQKIRLTGQGDPGFNGAKGDLYLVVEVNPDPRFELEGRDLRTKIPVTPSEAALGTDLEVETLEGSVRIKLPPGSSTGQKIRLKGRGLPNPKGTAGSLIAEVEITIPKEMSETQRSLYEQLREAETHRPRQRA